MEEKQEQKEQNSQTDLENNQNNPENQEKQQSQQKINSKDQIDPQNTEKKEQNEQNIEQPKQEQPEEQPPINDTALQDSINEQQKQQQYQQDIMNDMEESNNDQNDPTFKIFKAQKRTTDSGQQTRQSLLGNNTLGKKQASVPILSYKAEIIWDPQPSATDFYVSQNQGRKQNMYSNFLRSQTQTVIKRPIVSRESKEDLQKNTQVPFVNLEKDNYFQDIQNRKQYFGKLDSDHNTYPFCQQLQTISKPVPKRKRRMHKTKFKIPKTNKNIDVIQGICMDYINDHKKFVNPEIIKLPEYEKSAPFLPQSLEFADELLEDKILFKQKYGYEEKNLRKNKCVLETVVLSRLDKKQRQRQKVKVMKKPFDPNEIVNEEEIMRIQQEKLDQELQNFRKAQQINQNQSGELPQQQIQQQPQEQLNQYGIEQPQYYNKQGLQQMEKQLAQKRAEVLHKSGSSSRPKSNMSRKSSAKSQINLPKIAKNVVDFSKM